MEVRDLYDGLGGSWAGLAKSAAPFVGAVLLYILGGAARQFWRRSHNPATLSPQARHILDTLQTAEPGQPVDKGGSAASVSKSAHSGVFYADPDGRWVQVGTLVVNSKGHGEGDIQVVGQPVGMVLTREERKAIRKAAGLLLAEVRAYQDGERKKTALNLIARHDVD